jgi:endonuclease/exonuclease/phosphatase family metal-dependent hydrolase
MRVVSYNIRKAIGLDRRRKPERILEVLAEIDADVVALQEADRRFGQRISALPHHLIDDHGLYRTVPLSTHPLGIGWHGNALLVKSHVEILDCTVIHLPSIEPRGAVVADLRANGIDFRVVGLHLDLSGLWRRRQSAAILHHVATQTRQLPTILMGDTNEWTRGGCLRDFGQHHEIAPTGPSFHARKPIARLDRIFISAGLAVVDAGVHLTPVSRIASDHLPIWADLKTA